MATVIDDQRQRAPIFNQYVASPSSRPARGGKVPLVAQGNRYSNRAVGFMGRDGGTSANSAVADTPGAPVAGAPAGGAGGDPAVGGGVPSDGGATENTNVGPDENGFTNDGYGTMGKAAGMTAGFISGLPGGTSLGAKYGEQLGTMIEGKTYGQQNAVGPGQSAPTPPADSTGGRALGPEGLGNDATGMAPAAPAPAALGPDGLGNDGGAGGPVGVGPSGPTGGALGSDGLGNDGGMGGPTGEASGGAALGADGMGNDGGAGGPGDGGGGCFITEAVMSSGGADNGPELEALRMFRDQVLSATPQGQALIGEYEAIAPIVVEAISAREDGLDIFQNLDAQYIVPAVDAVKRGDYQAALQIYAQMIAAVTPFAAEMSGQSMPGGQDTEGMLEDFGSHAASMSYDHEAAQLATGADPLLDDDPNGYDGGPQTYGGGGGSADNPMMQQFATKPRF